MKKRLYLDIDDTVVDTENHIKRVLGGNWVDSKEMVYLEYHRMTDNEYYTVLEVFSDYFKIPYKPYAEEGLKLLQEYYDVVFCSSYHLECEKEAKIKWAESLGIELILCEGMTKDCVDMSDAIFIDDNPFNLNVCNAERLVWFCTGHDYYVDLEVDCDTVSGWLSLLNYLKIPLINLFKNSL